jgi:hypothetical protein
LALTQSSAQVAFKGGGVVICPLGGGIMAIGIVARNGETGKVIVQDIRPDGATLMFVCDEFAGEGVGAIFPLGDSTKAPAPVFPIPRSGNADTYELMTDATFELTPPRAVPFELKVETSSMPAALVPFAVDAFVAQVLSLVHDGVREAKITPENAHKWGFRVAQLMQFDNDHSHPDHSPGPEHGEPLA